MKPMRHAALSALILAILALSATPAPANAVLRYVRDRAFDLTDIFRFKVSVPEGNKSLGFHVKATSLAQVGLLHHDGHSVGMDRRVMGVWDETRTLYGVSLLTWTDIWRERVDGNQFADPNTPWALYARRSVVRAERNHWDDGRRSPLGLGMELHTAILPGFDFGFYPLEVIDFVGGVFLLDIRRDDLARVEAFYGRMTEDTELEPLATATHDAAGLPVFDPLADVVLEELGSQTTTGEMYRRMAPEAEQVDILSILDRSVRELPDAEPAVEPDRGAESAVEDAPQEASPANGAPSAEAEAPAVDPTPEPTVTPAPTPAP